MEIKKNGEKEDKFYIRYEREVTKCNPPEKEIEHLHANLKKPHFPSKFITLDEFLTFLIASWDKSSNTIEVK